MGQVTRRGVISGVVGAAAGGGLVLGGAGSAEAATYPTLAKGATGFWVQLLQNRLNRLGYWLGPATGRFDDGTLQAVWALQKAAGIARDGSVGPATWSKVNAGVRPTWKTRSGNLVEIDKSRQLLKVIRGGQLKYTLNTSTGSETKYYSQGAWHTAHTPSGSFRVLWTVNGVDTGPLGRLYRPRYFTYQGHAVHGEWWDVPPYPASHGCARVSNPAMDMVWANNYMPMGSTVLVY